MKSKYYATFLNRLSNLSADIEFLDVINISLNENRLHSDNSEYVFIDVKSEKHPLLASRKRPVKVEFL